jgi:AhpD family alkylhydroperoxidase
MVSAETSPGTIPARTLVDRNDQEVATRQPKQDDENLGGSPMPGKERLSIQDVDPTAYQALQGLERYVRTGDLEPQLLELVRIRASQINACAYCLDMHSHDARNEGEDQRRLDVLPAWRETTDMFTAREEAALALTEAVTRMSEEGVPDRVWDDVAMHFHEKQAVRLLMAIVTINVWNRLAVGTHQQLPQRA